MKTKFILLCAATAALAACAKTEVTPEVLNQDAEITFLTAPVTKSTIAFNEDNVFQSAAFYHVVPFAYGVTSEPYIEPVQVSCTDKTNHIWKAATTYYWPKDGGKLTFFSWTLNTNSLDFATGNNATVAIDMNNGVKLTDYTSASNDDFMVADIAKDQTQNTTPATYNAESKVAAGVPTLFKHKTAKVAFKALLKEDYTKTPYFQVFTITDINFVNVATKGDYLQNDVTTSAEKWSTTESGTLSYYNGSFEVNKTTAQDVAKTGTELYIPETYKKSTVADCQMLQVKYTVARNSNVKPTAPKEYTATISLKDLLGDTIDAAKRYTITLTFALDEILWDPAVEDWTDVAKSGEVNGNTITAE